MIKVNEVAHLYPQCKIWVKSHKDGSSGFIDHKELKYYADFDIKLHLRPLSSLTDAEKCELYDVACATDEDRDITDKLKIYYSGKDIRLNAFTPAQTLYLLKLSVDLFGLLDSLQAEKLEL